MTTRSYADAGVAAPGPGTSRNYTHDKALFDYFLLYYNNHVAGTADKHSGGSIDLTIDGAFPITTARSAALSSSYVEFDRLRHMWLELVDGDFTAGTFGSRTVPITLLNARNNIRGGLGSGNGLGIPGTDAPNTNPNTIPWRDANGFIPHVYAGQSMESNRELSAIANDTNNSVLIPAGRLHRPGIGWLIWADTFFTLPSAHATLNRWDVLYLGSNESGIGFVGCTQGTAVTLLANAVVPDPPENTFVICPVARIPASTATWNYSSVAGGALSPPGGVSYLLPLHHRATGTAPGDATMQARKLSDFAPTATVAPSKSVTVLAAQGTLAGVLVDFPQTTFTYDAGGTYDGVNSNPASPTAGTARWDGLSVNSSRQLIITLGTPAASIGAAALPTLPTVNTLKHVGFIAAIGSMTAVYPYQSLVNGTIPNGQGWIQDTVRFHNASVGSGGAASVGPILSGAQTGTVGGVNYDATDASGMSTNKGWGAERTGASTDGSLAEAILNKLPDDLQARLATSGNTATLTASTGVGNSVTLVVNGRARTVTAPLATAAATGGGGTRWLVADLTAAGAGFTISLMTGIPSGTPPTLTTYQKILRSYYWDSTTLHDDNASAPDFTPIQTVGSHQVTPDLLTLPRSAPYTTAADTNLTNLAQSPLAGMSDTYYFAKTCRIEATLALEYTMGTTSPAYAVCFRVTVDGVAIPFGDIFMDETAGLARTVCVQLPIFTVQGNAAHVIAVQAFTSNALGAYSTIVNSKYLQMKVLN